MNFKSCILAFVLQFSLAQIMLYGLTADFSISMDSPCVPALVVFRNESTQGPGIKYLWDFGKGALITSDAEVLYETYTEAGEYTIRLKVIEGIDTVQISHAILLVNGPTAALSTQPSSACVPGEILFSDNSSPGDAAITSWFWDFRDGNTVTGNPVSYTYEESGNYDIYLQISDANGCSAYIESFDVVRIFDLPVADFAVSDSFACDAPLEVNFTNLSSGYGALDYSWDFGNGQQSVNYEGSVTYAAGSWDVSLSVTDQHGCSDTLTRNALIHVGSVSGAIYATQGPLNYSEDGAVICPGIITLHSTLPALQDVIWEINYAGAVSYFEGTMDVPFLVPDSGRIDIMLRYNEESGCGDTLFRTFQIDHILADFEMDTAFTCQLPVDISMTNTSEGASDYTWLFPDGTSSNETNVSHTFESNTGYRQEYTHELQNLQRPVVLIATNDNNCSDTLIKKLIVSLPVARFMPDLTSGCVPLDITLSDSSQSSHPISSRTYLIEGEEYQLSTSDPFPYTFTDPGNYEILLIIENEAGCTDTSYGVMIQAGQTVDPWFSVDPISLCPHGILRLSDQSADQNLIDTWQYSSPGLFNTGAIHEPDIQITIPPSESGARDIYLVVESNGCSSDTVLNNAFSLESPSGWFREHFECDAPFDYTFTSITDGVDNISWRVNGLEVPGTDSMKYTFTESGDYQVEMILENITSGCTLIREKTIPVRDVHAGFFVKPVVCKNEDFEFDASLSIDYIEHCHVEGFLWNFDDDNPPRRNFSYIQEYSYSDTGVYNVSLVVTADNGCMDTAKFTIEVTEPRADFSVSPASGCGPDLEVDFDFYSFTSTVDNWTWQFGDGVVDASQNLTQTHTYHSGTSQTFQATLIAEDVYGCINQQTVPIELMIPTVNFHAIDNGICLGDVSQFIIDSPGLDSYTWDYGDGTGPTTSGTHTYADPGLYTVILDIVSGGCSATVSRPNYLSVEIADADFTVDDAVFTCYPATVNFNYTGNSSSIAQGIWTFQTGIQNPNFSPSVQYTYTEPGTYTSSLALITLNGCTASSSQLIEISGPTAAYSFSPSFMCSGDTVQFRIEALDDVDDFLWVFGDGDTSHQQNPSHVYTVRGELSPSLILIQGACEVTLSDLPLYVSTIHADFEIQPEQEFYCLNAPIYAQNLSEDFTSSVWTISNNPASRDTHLAGEFEVAGFNTIVLEVYNDLGCADTLEVAVMVQSPPYFTITGDTSICPGGEAALQVDPNADWTIQWQPEPWITHADQFEINASPDTTTFITATVTDEYGCLGSDSVLLRLKDPPAVQRVPAGDTSLFIGETIQLLVEVDDEAAQYFWTPDEHISCTECSDPLVAPLDNTTFTCHVTAECLDDMLEFPIEVIIDFYLELPTAFSPNEDGVNDVYHMEHNNIESVDFRIFNRWGNLMFATNDPDEGWDGRSAGKLQNPDSYAYLIHARTIHGYEFERKGTFILVK